MLSDEGKREYEELKSLLYQGTISQYGKRKLVEIIEKQSKEIEELRNEVMEKELMIDGMKEDKRIAVEEIQEQYYVSKDKINAKIEELNDGIKRDMINYDKIKDESWKLAIHRSMTQKIEIKKVLQSLLEKE